MTILLFSDLHSSAKALSWLTNLLAKQKFDLVIAPGDIVDRYDAKTADYLKKFVAICSKANVPTKVVFGNNEPEPIIGLYERRGISLHNKSYEQGGYTFIGIGDVEVHPDRMVDPTVLPIAGNILVTHRPPNKISNLKSKISKFKNLPAIHIAGHTHYQAFTEKIGETLVIHVPAAIDGQAAILQLPQKTVQFIKDHDPLF